MTENGNFILDTLFTSIPNVRKKEVELKSIAGVSKLGFLQEMQMCTIKRIKTDHLRKNTSVTPLAVVVRLSKPHTPHIHRTAK